MESVSLRSYSDAYRGTGKHPNMNVETQIPLELHGGYLIVYIAYEVLESGQSTSKRSTFTYKFFFEFYYYCCCC